MNLKERSGWLKHIDFILLDLVCLQCCFILAHWIVVGFQNPYQIPAYQFQALVLLIAQLFVCVFSKNYKNILKRGWAQEAGSVIKYVIMILLISLVLLFLIHRTDNASRLQFGVTLVLLVVVSYLMRQCHKKLLLGRSASLENRKGKSLVLITAGRLVDSAMDKLVGTDTYRDYFVSGIVLIDGDKNAIKKDYGVSVIPVKEDGLSRIQNGWVDAVFLLQPDELPLDKDMLLELRSMGVMVHFTMAALQDTELSHLEMGRLGRYKVLSTGIRFIRPEQQFVKRMMDVIGGVLGTVVTGILFLFVAPAIYKASPGPIFFKQERIGRNGKTFYMYKFRSMYLDAEERKAALMAQNKVESDFMFKMDDDPRIIGSEKKDKQGRPKGIGNFIRNTSIDEFPQFLNVLRGEMSLVGTRPPLLKEWELYDAHHRARMTVKPGITGLWQVSGRSEITDFEEVVRLDIEYIEEWSLMLDFRILCKTVGVVVKGRGAE